MMVVQAMWVKWSPNIKPNYFPDGELHKGGDGYPFFMPVYLCNKHKWQQQNHLHII